MSEYVLRVGEEGAERLRLLTRVIRANTEALIRTVGLTPGMKCLDLGCGIGEVTLFLAAQVGPSGGVTGIDREARFLELARQSAAQRHLHPVFRQADALELADESAYDLVYARFLFSHLADPENMLTRMVRAARPGGVIVVEDTDFPGHFSYPPCPALLRYVELYQAVVRYNGGDAAIGPRLPGLLLDAGLDPVELNVVLPTFRLGEGKWLNPVTLAHVRGAILQANLATAAEMDTLIAEMEAFARDPRTLWSIARIFQVWGRKK